MRSADIRYGLQTMCEGGGTANATIVELAALVRASGGETRRRRGQLKSRPGTRAADGGRAFPAF